MTRLYEQLANRLATEIEQGAYPVGDRLPGLRRLATRFGVSLSTTVEACRLLEDRGLIETRTRSGMFVRLPQPQRTSPVPPRRVEGPTLVANQALALRLVQATLEPHVVQLGAAVPDACFLPGPTLARILARIARHPDASLSGYAFPPGLPALRRQLARRMTDLGCAAVSEEIVITSGAQEALGLALRAITEPGDVVAIESPTFYGLLQVIESLGLKALEIPTDPIQGLSVEALQLALEQWPVRACIVVPHYSNPLGYLMPEARKQALLDLVTRHDIALIEDDIYGDLGFGGLRPVPIKAWDRTGQVIYCASCSKTLSPGLRVGWMLPGRYQSRIEYLKYVLNLAVASIPQAMVAAFLAQAGYERYLRATRRAHAQAVQRLREAATLSFPEGTRISQPAGGFVLWIEFPPGVDALALCEQAAAEGISLAPGPLFSATGRYPNCVRLNAALPWTPALEAALRRIGRLAWLQLDR